MKHIKINTLFFGFLANFAMAQVGINTNSPAANTILHVDGASDNATSDPNKANNDVVVTTSGSLVIGGTSADASAAVDVKGVTKGFTIPKLTNAQIAGIATPIDGMSVYSTDDQCMKTYTSSKTPSWYCNNAVPNNQETTNVQRSTFTANTPAGAELSQICLGTLCVKHSGEGKAAYLLLKSNTAQELNYSSVAIYKMYRIGNGPARMDIDNSGWFLPDIKNPAYDPQNNIGANRPLVKFLTRYPVTSDQYDPQNQRLLFTNGRVDVGDIAIYQVNDGTTGSNYRITFTKVQVAGAAGQADVADNSKYLIVLERMSSGYPTYTDGLTPNPDPITP